MSSVIAKSCPSGSRGIDSLPFSEGGTQAQANAFAASGKLDFVALYLGIATPELNTACLAAGLMTFGVTTANNFDGLLAVRRAQLLGFPPGTSLFLDLEGQSIYTMPIPQLTDLINGWARIVKRANFIPGIYVGSPQPFTSMELFKLAVERYWRAPARIVDRLGNLAEPSCGWCMMQCFPSMTWRGVENVLVDVNFVTQDFRGRTPTMAYLPPAPTAPTPD